MRFKDNIRVSDRFKINGKNRRGGNPVPSIRNPRLKSNVKITLRKEVDGEIVEERSSHNIFLNYGREWLAELISLDTAAPFRSDRIAYMAFGIGGTSQRIPYTTINAMQPGPFPQWQDYANGAGGAAPVQTDTDPDVTGLEWPVIINESSPGVANYYDEVARPATFPEIGTVRFTAILGYTDISYSGALGVFTEVPISEMGLFTEGVTDRTVVPWNATHAPTGERYMVAYNTFPEINKTSSFVMQVDWELIIS